MPQVPDMFLRPRHWLPVLLLTALPVPARAQAPDRDSLPHGVTAAMVEDGRRIFAGPGVCFACHGPAGVGGIGPSLADSVWIHSGGEYDRIVATILAGVTQKDSRTGSIMPPRGGSAISDADIRAVAAYVWSLSHHRP